MHRLIDQRRAEIAALCRRYQVRRLEVFGSAARGSDFDAAASDADFLVSFEPGSDLPPLEQFFGLADALRRLLRRPVDLVESGAVSNPLLRAEIDRAREIVYAAWRPHLPLGQPGAADAIERFVAGLDVQTYAASEVVHTAVERKFEVIGEALSQLARLDPALASRIPNLREIIAFRNVLIHGYAAIEHARVWRIIETSLPDLRATVSALIDELGSTWNDVRGLMDRIDARDHALAMAAHARGEDPGLTDAELDEYLAAPTPLAYWRKHRGLTQAALAAAAGISQPYLAQLESGRRASADIAVYAKLAKRLAVRIEDLLAQAE